MKIKEFMESFGIRNEKKVREWIEKGLMPGTYVDGKTQDWFLPELSKPPYTAQRAKTVSAICVSIVEGCNRRKGVSAKLYKIPEKEFRIYIESLIKEGFISVQNENGIDFYFATSKSQDYIGNKSRLKKIIENSVSVVVEAAAKGVTEVVLASC